MVNDDIIVYDYRLLVDFWNKYIADDKELTKHLIPKDIHELVTVEELKEYFSNSCSKYEGYNKVFHQIYDRKNGLCFSFDFHFQTIKITVNENDDYFIIFKMLGLNCRVTKETYDGYLVIKDYQDGLKPHHHIKEISSIGRNIDEVIEEYVF